jgi:hypothetical protein
MNKDQGWIACAPDDEINMVRTIPHVSAPRRFSLISALYRTTVNSFHGRPNCGLGGSGIALGE